MKPNFIFDPIDNPHPSKMPISPQNYDPHYPGVGHIDKTSNYPSQKKIIFSSGNKSRPQNEILQEYDQSRSRQDDTNNLADLRASLSGELKSNLENLRAEMVQQFNTILKDFKNTGKISQE